MEFKFGGAQHDKIHGMLGNHGRPLGRLLVEPTLPASKCESWRMCCCGGKPIATQLQGCSSLWQGGSVGLRLAFLCCGPKPTYMSRATTDFRSILEKNSPRLQANDIVCRNARTIQLFVHNVPLGVDPHLCLKSRWICWDEGKVCLGRICRIASQTR